MYVWWYQYVQVQRMLIVYIWELAKTILTPNSCLSGNWCKHWKLFITPQCSNLWWVSALIWSFVCQNRSVTLIESKHQCWWRVHVYDITWSSTFQVQWESISNINAFGAVIICPKGQGRLRIRSHAWKVLKVVGV